MLVVQLRTDYAPGVEVDAARVEITQGAETLASEDRVLEVGEDYVAGVRLAEVAGLTTGDYRVTVTLFSSGATRAVRRIALSHPGGRFAVTALISRSCLDVSCPMDGEDASLSECVGGRCVEETCTAETPESCPAPECTDASGCPPSTDCTQAACVDGVCLETLDSSVCPDGERCIAGSGCFPETGTCAADLDCGHFDAMCLAGLMRRCAYLGVRDDNLVQLAVVDVGSGAVCSASTLETWPGIVSGAPQLFGGGTVWASNLPSGACATFRIDFETGRSAVEASPCGLPTPLTNDELVWVQHTDAGSSEGVIHRPGGTDIPFSAPTRWGSLFSLGPGEAALRQENDEYAVLDLTTGQITQTIVAPGTPQGVWRENTSFFFWAVGRGTDLELVTTEADGTELDRLPVMGLPPLMPPFGNYVGAGCAF